MPTGVTSRDFNSCDFITTKLKCMAIEANAITNTVIPMIPCRKSAISKAT